MKKLLAVLLMLPAILLVSVALINNFIVWLKVQEYDRADIILVLIFMAFGFGLLQYPFKESQ